MVTISNRFVNDNMEQLEKRRGERNMNCRFQLQLQDEHGGHSSQHMTAGQLVYCMKSTEVSAAAVARLKLF